MSKGRVHQSGAISVPLLLLLGGTFSLGVGLWSVLRRERMAQRLQLQALSCVGLQALLFKDLQNAIETQNEEIQVLRASIAASIAAPEVLPPLRAALSSLVLAQDLSLAAHQAREFVWQLEPPCRDLGILPLVARHPAPGWQRPPADPLGPNPLKRPEGAPESFEFSMEARQRRIERHAFAHVLFERTTNTWTAAWGRPRDGALPFRHDRSITH